MGLCRRGRILKGSMAPGLWKRAGFRATGVAVCHKTACLLVAVTMLVADTIPDLVGCSGDVSWG